ncbi:MAG TPA: DUF1772 domain-containing protein [Candidatus Angelobacter sp.]|nr:DUF1772 domain-containing protein [Candidatus Angelobacter sp.]
MRTVSCISLWLFVVGTAFILGAGLYEALVVVPFWSDGAPASLTAGNPLLQVQIRAGHAFWQYYTPALGLIAVLALLTGLRTAQRHLVWRVAATGLLILVSVITLAYFRPTVIELVVNHGAGRTPEAVAGEVRRWVELNWVRVVAVAASLAMGVRALFLPAQRF